MKQRKVTEHSCRGSDFKSDVLLEAKKGRQPGSSPATSSDIKFSCDPATSLLAERCVQLNERQIFPTLLE